ncbi:MAG TPA: type III pantothenate kinase [Gemmatimonadaceae bacterium]|nr:type III pantothenate kinase [Gemmatimonadaceae bacterium]
MILVFDVGNTETTVGLFDGEQLREHWRLTTDVARTADELAVLIHMLLNVRGVSASTIDGSAIGSVVPALTGPLTDACAQSFGRSPVIVDARAGLPITLDVEEPQTVGADRLINTLAASRLYERDTIVVDLGTATTYDCITAAGVFLGGVIQPGVRTSAETLFRRTSKLPATELVPPQRVIGRRTEECIRAGVLLGAAESIDGLVRRIKGEWPGGATPLVVATGGLAETLHPFCSQFDRVEPFLTLVGLRIAYDLLGGSAGSGRRAE